MSPTPTPTPPRSVMAALLARTAPGATLLVGVRAGAGTPAGTAVPILVLEVRGERAPVERWDGPVSAEDLGALYGRLGELFRVWPGELDDARPGRWSVGWTLPPAPFRLLGRKGLRCSLDGGRLLVGRRRLRAREVSRVRTALYPDRSAVFIELEGGRPAEICQRMNRVGESAPTPGHEWDWAAALARRLAGALGVAFGSGDPPDGS